MTGPDQAPRLPRVLLGTSLLAPGRLHAGVHHRARDVRKAECGRSVSTCSSCFLLAVRLLLLLLCWCDVIRCCFMQCGSICVCAVFCCCSFVVGHFETRFSDRQPMLRCPENRPSHTTLALSSLSPHFLPLLHPSDVIRVLLAWALHFLLTLLFSSIVLFIFFQAGSSRSAT